MTAARQGVKTALVQDRPVLGGNASKEMRVPPVGAANCNFAYSRETGLVEELYLTTSIATRPGVGRAGTLNTNHWFATSPAWTCS